MRVPRLEATMSPEGERRQARKGTSTARIEGVEFVERRKRTESSTRCCPGEPVEEPDRGSDYVPTLWTTRPLGEGMSESASGRPSREAEDERQSRVQENSLDK